MKPSKKALKIAGISALALVAAAAVVWLVLFRFGNSGLQGRIAALRAAGDPVSLKDLARPAVPAEQNAASFLFLAQNDVDAINKTLSPVYDGAGYRQGKLSESDRTAIRRALAAHPKAIPLLEQASACPDFDAQLNYTGGPSVLMTNCLGKMQGFRGVANLLRARAYLLAAEGNPTVALGSCTLLFRLTRLYEREPPLLVTYLVTAASRSLGVETANVVLRSGAVDQTAHAELEKEFAATDGLEGYRRALRDERAFGIESFDAIPGAGLNPFLSRDRCEHLDQMADQLALAEKPFAEVLPALLRIKQGKSASQPLTGLVMPAVLKAREAMDRVRAQMRCLRVLNALMRISSLDAKLSDLGLPAEATTDPYNGSPLHIKRVAGGWLIYAVGENLTDDGGDLSGMKDVGLGPQ